MDLEQSKKYQEIQVCFFFLHHISVLSLNNENKEKKRKTQLVLVITSTTIVVISIFTG